MAHHRVKKIFSVWLTIICCTYATSETWAENKAIVKPVPNIMLKYRPIFTREAQAVFGINAPVAMFASQVWQESSGRESITASDGGMGLSQFMPTTSTFISQRFPELGPPAPYNPTWAIRAQVRYDGWIRNMVKGKDDCHRFAAALKGYNAGPGYVKQAQTKSPQPDIWFGVTEYIPTKQSAMNLEYSRTYPRKILFSHQKLFRSWGGVICDIDNPPYDEVLRR